MKVPLNESVHESHECLIQKSRFTEMIQNPLHWLLRCDVWWRARYHSFAGITVSKQWRGDTFTHALGASCHGRSSSAKPPEAVNDTLRKDIKPAGGYGVKYGPLRFKKQRLGNCKVLRFMYLVNSHGALMCTFNLLILWCNRPPVSDWSAQATVYAHDLTCNVILSIIFSDMG